jgi:hypothetical protein
MHSRSPDARPYAYFIGIARNVLFRASASLDLDMEVYFGRLQRPLLMNFSSWALFLERGARLLLPIRSDLKEKRGGI